MQTSTVLIDCKCIRDINNFRFENYLDFIYEKNFKTALTKFRLSSHSLAIEFGWLVGWLVVLKRPFETVFQSISGRLPKRGRKRRERIDESKKCPNNSHPHLLQAQ